MSNETRDANCIKKVNIGDFPKVINLVIVYLINNLFINYFPWLYTKTTLKVATSLCMLSLQMNVTWHLWFTHLSWASAVNSSANTANLKAEQ